MDANPVEIIVQTVLVYAGMSAQINIIMRRVANLREDCQELRREQRLMAAQLRSVESRLSEIEHRIGVS